MGNAATELNALKGNLMSAIKDIPKPDHRTASYQFDCLKRMILEYQSTLDADHEIAVTLASFGDNVTMLVEEIYYIDPVLFVFKGMVGDNYSTLIQHVSQLNILLTTVTKHDPEKPARRIGFDISG